MSHAVCGWVRADGEGALMRQLALMVVVWLFARPLIGWMQ